MTTVRESTIDLLRAHGLTTWFGNPGSSELTLLADFPGDFRYLLGLQEMVPVGMADGFSQITGHPAPVNLHTAPGVGNAMGAIYNAAMNKTPLVVTAGNQRRAMQNQRCLRPTSMPPALPGRATCGRRMDIPDLGRPRPGAGSRRPGIPLLPPGGRALTCPRAPP